MTGGIFFGLFVGANVYTAFISVKLSIVCTHIVSHKQTGEEYRSWDNFLKGLFKIKCTSLSESVRVEGCRRG